MQNLAHTHTKAGPCCYGEMCVLTMLLRTHALIHNLGKGGAKFVSPTTSDGPGCDL